MASFNYVRLIGFITEPAKISDFETHMEVKLFLHTRRRYVNKILGPLEEVIEIRYTVNKLKKDKSVYENLRDMQPLVDIYEVTGVYVANAGYLEYDCNECGEHIQEEVKNMPFVFPKSAYCIKRLEQETEHKEVSEYLKEHYEETSNRVFIMGHVCGDIPSISSNTDLARVRYCLGISRHVYINLQKNIKSDFPYVYSYGEQAKTDAKYIKKGSLVLVDGFIRTTVSSKDSTCPLCGKLQKVETKRIDIVTYNTEYLRNMRDPIPEIERNPELKDEHYKLIELSLSESYD